MQTIRTESIAIRNPSPGVPETLTVEKLPLGVADDYKPNVARMPDGELLLTAFHTNSLKVKPDQRFREDILLVRSRDNGRTWSEPDNLGRRCDLVGREPYLSVLNDGTILLTCHFPPREERNDLGYTANFIHRSSDGGKTWTTREVLSDEFPKGIRYATTRNILERGDGTLMIVVTIGELGKAFIWSSADRGRTWRKASDSRVLDLPEGYPYGVFEESHLARLDSGRLIMVSRVDHRYYPLTDRTIQDEEYDVINRIQAVNGAPPIEKCPRCGYRSLTDRNLLACSYDQFDHLKFFVSRDDGATWRPGADLGDYGMMYPSILRLEADRVLFTFTVRHIRPPLGVRAVVGRETTEGFDLDLNTNQFVLDDHTPIDRPSGGGFGNTVQADDGTLVTPYSYRDDNNDLHMEVVRWQIPETL